MKTIKQLAQEVLNNLETKKRKDDKEFIALKNHEPQWHVDLCLKAHENGDILPNDYIYKEIENSLMLILDAEGETEDEIREYTLDGNFIEGDIYNFDLLAWVSSNLYFAEYVDRALEECCIKGFFNALQVGNQLFKEAVFYSVLDSLSERAQLGSQVKSI